MDVAKILEELKRSACAPIRHREPGKASARRLAAGEASGRMTEAKREGAAEARTRLKTRQRRREAPPPRVSAKGRARTPSHFDAARKSACHRA